VAVKKLGLVVLGGAALLLVAWTSVGDVHDEIDDYQDRSSCRRADLDFNGKVNLDDLRMISGDAFSGEGGFFGRVTFPYWYDQDGDKLISILDTSRVASMNGRTC
jgi:hypothetical protein